MRVLLFSAVLLVAVFDRSQAAKIPTYFGKPCSRSLPEAELSACGEKAANMGIPSLTNGDKKLRIGSLNPLLIPRVALSQGSNSIGLNLTWEPLRIDGLHEAKISNMKMSWKDKTLAYDLSFATFTLSGPYKASGKILLLPITGSGPSNFTFRNLRLRYSFDFPLTKGADGKDHATLINSKIKITNADDMKCELKGLFNGDKLLGDQMNFFLNDNWREVLRELGPSMIDPVLLVIENVGKTLVSSVPADELLTP